MEDMIGFKKSRSKAAYGFLLKNSLEANGECFGDENFGH